MILQGYIQEESCGEKNIGFKLDWSVLLYPPNSPDLAPSDFHLFCSLNDKSFSQEGQAKMFVENFLS